MSEQSGIYWANCRVKLGDLKPWERNPKTISKAHARRLLANHKDFGQWQDVAIGPENEVYDGHQRLNVWLAAYGPNFEIDAKRASRALTEQERERFVIEAHVGTVGSLNYDALANWNAPRLMEAGFDADLLKEFKTGAAALDNFLKSEQPAPVDAEPQIDRAAELNEKWQVKPGDLWRIGEHRLLCGDSTVRADVERVMGGERADIVFSDIPYGIDYSGGRTQVVRHKPYGKIAGDAEKDISIFVYPLLELEAVDTWVCCSPANLAPALRPFDERGGVSGIVIWDKKSPGLGYQWIRRQTEFILFETRRDKPKSDSSEFDLWSISRDDTKEYQHGNQKPTALVMRALRFSKPCGNNVADLFAGSGSTLAAAQNLNMKCFAVEKTDTTCAVILQRMADAFPGIEIERI